jgi:hypothetical protein
VGYDTAIYVLPYSNVVSDLERTGIGKAEEGRKKWNQGGRVHHI